MDVEQVRAFYDDYGLREWERLETSPEGRIIYHLHRRFLDGHFGPAVRVLDAGSGPGRFSIHMAEGGSRVTLLDLSPEQLRIAKCQLEAHGLADRVDGFHQGDVRRLDHLAAGSFDTVVCFGAVLNYLLQDAAQAVRELARVARPGGTVLVSVNSRIGTLRWFAVSGAKGARDFLSRPDYWPVHSVASSGDFPAHPELGHPDRHLYLSGELADLMTACGLRDVKLATAPALATGYASRLEEIYQCPAAWATLLDLEEQAYEQPGLLDAGYFILAKATA